MQILTFWTFCCNVRLFRHFPCRDQPARILRLIESGEWPPLADALYPWRTESSWRRRCSEKTMVIVIFGSAMPESYPSEISLQWYYLCISLLTLLGKEKNDILGNWCCKWSTERGAGVGIIRWHTTNLGVFVYTLVEVPLVRIVHTCTGTHANFIQICTSV